MFLHVGRRIRETDILIESVFSDFSQNYYLREENEDTIICYNWERKDCFVWQEHTKNNKIHISILYVQRIIICL